MPAIKTILLSALVALTASVSAEDNMHLVARADSSSSSSSMMMPTPTPSMGGDSSDMGGGSPLQAPAGGGTAYVSRPGPETTMAPQPSEDANSGGSGGSSSSSSGIAAVATAGPQVILGGAAIAGAAMLL